MIETNEEENLSDVAVEIPVAPPVSPPSQPEASNPLLARLLKIADGYRAANAIRQAVPMYFELVEDYPNAPEAAKARQRLLKIGEMHEQNGELRQARGIYERLL